MNNKRKLYLIQFEDCYEVWLAKSKDSLIEKYQSISRWLVGFDCEKDITECKEITLQDVISMMDGDVDTLMTESIYNILLKQNEDALFFTNFI